VLTWSFGSLHPGKQPSEANPGRVLFHPSDFIYFGLRHDVLNIWEIPLMTPAEADWFAQGTPRWAVPDMKNRHFPEDFIWTTFLRKNGCQNISQSWADFNDELLRASQLSIVNNLLLLNQQQYGFYCFKYPVVESGYCWGEPFTHYFTNRDWQLLYQQYCDPQHQPPRVDPLQWNVLCQDWGKSLFRYYCKTPERYVRWLRDRLRGKKPWPWNYKLPETNRRRPPFASTK